MVKKGRKRRFSAVKAVKETARDRVGQPRPSRPIEPRGRERPERKRKHRKTLEQMLERETPDTGE